LKEKILDYLRIGRVQTFPADWLLTLTPFLYGRLNLVQATLLSIFIWFVHFSSFGHNSLMDTAMGYDLKDLHKKHHPLVAGRIQLSEAHNVIHWLLCTLTVCALIFSLKLSPAPLYAVLCIPIWTMFGYAYNSGLSKESVFGFIPISICFTFMGAWGWFLSHETLNTVGYLYLGYVFCTILFQISYSGFKKELLIKERSNILVRLGAKVENGVFKPSRAGIYGVTIKGLNWLIGLLLLLQNFNIIRLLWFIVISSFVFVYLIRLTKPREYIRDRELLDMSLEEVATIYLVVPILLDSLVAALLMVIGLFYFLIVNRILWKAPFPRV
jgi:4-hydroxybenzoate polyprenyltransferase